MSSNSEIPADAPPSYHQATGSSSRPAATSSGSSQPHLGIPGKGESNEQNGIPIAARRSMEDEMRPLPEGWVRTFDPESKHQFFVDTTKDPPRSIWMHPYDDEQYLSTLSSEERERVEQESLHRGHPHSKEDIMAAHTDDEEEHSHTTTSKDAELPPRPENKSFGRKWKDKITGSTHEEREAQRAKRAEEERKAYAFHQRVRQAMATAAQTGKPELVGKDTSGKEIYVEPPDYSGGYSRGYGYNPYGSSGVYSTPNARYIRPSYPYSRPYGYGYGGGYGYPYGGYGGYGYGGLGLGLGGGLLGGLLIGDALGGFI